MFQIEDYNIPRMKQISETYTLAGIITLSGGLQDAYTYFAREHVFANAQTGNIILLGSKLADGEFSEMLRYLFPVLSFMIGIFIAEQIQGRFRQAKKLHWRQFILLLEIIALIISGFFTEERNLVSNSLVSFACALQVQTFKHVNGYSYASTMCIGNMRSGISSFSNWTRTKNKRALKQAGVYMSVILTFAIGACIGYLLIPYLGLKTIWVSSGLLCLGFILMFYDSEKSKDMDRKNGR